MHGKKVVAKYEKMSARELHTASAAFDKDMIVDQSRPLTAEELAWWKRVRRQPGRPRRGRGSKVISVSVEQDLLAQTDVLARSLGISRALLVQRGLKAVLAAEGRL